MKIGIKQSFPCEFGVSLEILQTLSKLGQLFWDFLCYKKTKTKWVWRISKLSPNSLQTQKNMRAKTFLPFDGLAARIFFLKKTCARIFFWVWREFGDSPNPVLMLIKEKTWKLTSSKHFPVSSKLFPNSYVQYLFFFFEKERSELEYSPNSFETHLSLEHQHTKNRMFFVVRSWNFQSFAASLECSKLTPNSNVFGLFLLFFLCSFFWWERSEFQTSTHTKRKHVFHVAQNISIFFCGRKVKFSKFGCELRVWIQVHSKIT